MKRFGMILVTILLIICSASFTVAQYSSVGIKSGINLSKLDYETDIVEYDLSFLKGLNIGIFLECDLSTIFLIHGEVIYSQRGTNVERISIHPSYNQELDYLDIPVLIQYNYLIDSKITPKIFIGPVASYLLSAKRSFSDGNNFDQKDKFKSYEFGIIFGVGADYNLSTGKIVFDIRYQHGITNITKPDQGSKITTNTISFNIGYGVYL